ncbi:protein NRT1/ PTR FAMILY 2.11-like [Cornus florida]|uniref:protein NRT1/ PTR FAMILY 2.11-like n=1 Tax=Cornus florida TaxID=4283 RepID=UPI00289B93ED|nr:protein NRT1/ PTR FAMILY 2.11-like [Cornus florida]
MEKNREEVTSNEPKHRGVIAMPFVIGNETFEKLGTIGTTSNLLVYLSTVFHMKTITATNLLNIFNGTCNFGTLIGAFLSDAYFGRYITLGFSSVSSFLGMLVLALTAAVSRLHPPSCGTKATDICKGPTAWQMTFLLSGFGLLVVGAAGIRPCNLAFGADQFNPNTESGKRGITSFFNWYYFTYTFAMMISLTAIVYVQSDVSWALGLAVPSIMMFFSCALFFAGTKIYVKVTPQGSPLTSVAQVMVAAFKKRPLKLPERPWCSLFNHYLANSINSRLPYTDQFRFLNKAAVITPKDEINSDGSAANPWKLCSIQQVEEVKCLMRVIPIWVSLIFYNIAVIQQQNYAVFQALQCDRRLGNTGFKIPAASYIFFNMLSLTVWIPIYDRIVVPFLRKRTKIEDGITLLQKTGIGMVISVVTMIVSGIVEERRRTLALTEPTLGNVAREGAISSMSGLWLVPQLALTGLSEAFTLIGLSEFFYKQFPENMRSISGSFFFCGLAGSSYLSALMVSMVHHTTKKSATGNWFEEDLNKGRLDYFYYLIGVLEVINLGYFLMCTKWYKYKGDGGNNLNVDMEDMALKKPIV